MNSYRWWRWLMSPQGHAFLGVWAIGSALGAAVGWLTHQGWLALIINVAFCLAGGWATGVIYGRRPTVRHEKAAWERWSDDE